MRRKAGIILEYLLALVVIILLLLAIAGVVAVKFHGDDLQEYVMDQLSDRFDAEIDIDDISVRVLHKFPSTSIVLENATVWSNRHFNTGDFEGRDADTLLSAERISLSFNLFGIFRKRFTVRQVEITHGSLSLFTDREGNGNYELLRDPDDRKGRERLVEISQLKAQDFSIRLNNLAKNLKASGWLDQLELNGRFSRKNTQIRSSLKGSLHEVSNKGILYASDRSVELRTQMDLQDSVFIVKTGHLQIDRITADMDGRFYIDRGKGVQMDLVAAARDLEIHEVLDLLPSELSNPLREIRGSGILQVYARVTGRVSSTLTPFIEADFETSSANLFWERVPFSVKNLNLAGTYSNGGEFNPVSTQLTIESISGTIGLDHLSGRGEIKNFYEPDFAFDLKGEIHPEQWIIWYPSIPIRQASGKVFSDISVSGSYDRLKPRGKKFVSFDISGTMGLEDIMLRITRDGIPFREVNGSVRMRNDLWEPSFTGTFGESDFSVEGTGLNLISFFLQGDEKLMASATFRSNHLDLGEVLGQIPARASGNNSGVTFPENLDLRLQFIINEFVQEKLNAGKVRGTALYDSPFLYVDSLTMQTMQGTMRGSFGMTQDTRGSIFTSVDAKLYSLDIRELFEAFNNFGQKQLTYEHLRGSISGTSVFSAEFDSTFSILPATIRSENDITIRDGELNGFTPIMALSRFIEVEELQNIRFETLTNNILIHNSQVIIPVMDIRSNALNLSASGTHDFENRYDYRLTLKLSELLYSKSRGSRNHEFEIARDESDQRTLFLKIYDNGSGATVEMDREKTANKIRDDLKNERTELKQILHDELGLFRRDDDLVLEQDTGKEGEVFRFEFPENADSSSTKGNRKGRARWRKRGSKPDTLQNKPAVEFVIEE